MGRRNIDRIPIREFRAAVATVADMQAKGWEVISRCGTCGLMMRVDLDLVAWRSGAKTILWNRKARCRRIGCQGFVEFQARAPGASNFEALVAEWPEDKPARLAAAPTLERLFDKMMPLEIWCGLCSWKAALTPDEAVVRFGRQTTFEDVRRRLKAKCGRSDCWATAGMALRKS